MRSRPPALIVATLLAVGLAGCEDALTGPLAPGSGPEGVALKVQKTDYGKGDTIRAVLSNESEQAVGYNLCLFAMERRDGAGWERVVRHPDGACQAVLLRLEPGAVDTLRQFVRDELPDGIYRFRDEVTFPFGDGMSVLASNAFRIDA